MKLKKEDLSIEWYPTTKGLIVYMCFSKQSQYPLGYLFISGASTCSVSGKLTDVWEIIECYVPEWARRRGIMTFMLDNLPEDCILTTGSGSKAGGSALLKSYGFKQDSKTTFWYKDRRKKNGKNKGR